MYKIKITDTESGNVHNFETNGVFSAINQGDHTKMIIMLSCISRANYIDMLAAVYTSLKKELEDKFNVGNVVALIEELEKFKSQDAPDFLS